LLDPESFATPKAWIEDYLGKDINKKAKAEKKIKDGLKAIHPKATEDEINEMLF
jgi:t-SNARE complex subunit (syntaxin)